MSEATGMQSFKAGGTSATRVRVAGWGTAALLLLVPALAMLVTDEVDWNLFDFAVAAVLMGGVGATLELAVRRTRDLACRAATALALVTALVLIWVNGAVGMIGSESNPANLMYGGVLAIALLGGLAARFRPAGMARAMLATALAQALVPLVALTAGMVPATTGPAELVAGTAIFVVPWLTAALLFRRSARA